MSYLIYTPGMICDMAEDTLKIPLSTLSPRQNQFIELLEAFERWLAASPYGRAYELMRLWGDFDYLSEKDIILK